ncbi:hypothetical protein [Capsulimonas corticalis]|uniref:hypothetical protein n=1 Tax=Capsulimonas corticalis TaxID=2219043 RepID=UPI000E65A983|nr:hypothetical protein [Capsulimonas corticalis]
MPKDTSPPVPGDTAAQVAAAFGRLVSGFGNVDAIAAPTIVVVNAPPEKPNIYDGMAPGPLIRLLASTFSEDQWKAFLSAKGLAYSELAREDQKAMFEALFPGGKMVVLPIASVDPSVPPTEVGGDQLRLAKIRLTDKTEIGLSTPNQPEAHVFSAPYQPPDTPSDYAMVNTTTKDVDREFGAVVRETVPNTLKASDLDSGDPSWKTRIPISTISTVDDAARAIATATQREIYVDPRYAAMTVTMRGPGTPVRAYDLMRTLAICLGAAWRQVGSALLLTNDKVGLGAKREMWGEFEARAAALLPTGKSDTPIAQPEGSAFTVKDIPFSGANFPFSAKQLEKYWKQEAEAEMQNSLDEMRLTLPFAQLTPEQQDAARHTQEANTRSHVPSTLTGDVWLTARPRVQVLIPALPAPVDIDDSYQRLLPAPPMNAAEQAASDHRAEEARRPDQNTPHTPADLLALIRSFDRRAVLADAHTPEEIDRVIADMKTLALTELWLRIPLSGGAQSDGAEVALLRHAAKSAQAAGVSLIPEVRVLAWGDQSAEKQIDRTILGRTPRQQIDASGKRDQDVHDTVSPFDPESARCAAALMATVGSIPGITGMLWADATPPGYEAGHGDQDSPAALGYTMEGRLACLRQTHADPIDLDRTQYPAIRAHVGVPGFGDDDGGDAARYDSWRAVRADVERKFLAVVTSALPVSYSAGHKRLPILIRADGDFGEQYALLDAPDKPIYAGVSIFVRPDAPDALQNAFGALTMFQGLKAHSVVLNGLGEADTFHAIASAIAAR